MSLFTVTTALEDTQATTFTQVPSVSAPAADFAALLSPFTPDSLANGFSTLIGALVGAMLAYLLQRRFQQLKEHNAALMAAHRLMFSLLQQINTIVLIQRDNVFDEINNPGRFISIPATPPYDTRKNILELLELEFLLQEAEGRNLLYDFYIAQENYIEALNQWNLRSSFHLEYLQPALAASGIQNGSLATSETMRNALGDQTYFHAINATDNCILTLQRAFEKLAPLKASIRSYLVKRFKTNDFIDFNFPDTWGLMENP
ncbi:hypothetical protein EKK97_06540 [Billgrantia tianxiuensis]|jgi:hypothetical protein|uniref:Uncharacterized protein n=1 Tax=Billgrantia tianxiuensis TaxID=2497861 RepID=A0A6I6SNB1_9GAMM|nr:MULTISPECIES: hypothetical protein [Halomonas]MCE8032762.1 hypothetical protein [Halomonas sp. MCCC 1A11057]QHC49340.1 hypothetical protein EKK97_06540 [Halomonas tianxiuensis]